jgi:catechol 2,3-dioxygenase-like lactoylglutathione lyase family enzyme
MQRSPLLSRVDHIVLATPDVNATIEDLTQRLGVRADRGGHHPAWGTQNALIALGDTIYLEIFGPDPAQSGAHSRPFGVDELQSQRIATWSARALDLEELVRHAKSLGIDLGGVQARSRMRPDAVEWKWAMTDPFAPRCDGIVPFFIDWAMTPHPASTAVQGGELIRLEAIHPRANEVRAVLAAFDLDLPVHDGPAPELIATIRTKQSSIIEIR